MGCGASIVPKCSPEQRNEMFTAATKEMMKICLVDGYVHRDKIEVLAPSEAMASLRAFVEKLREASAVAREKCEDTMEGATDKANELAEKAQEALSGGGAGMIGGLLGGAVAMATDLAGKGANVAASGAGLVAEKAIQAVAFAMDEAISAVDQPFKDVGKDIFNIKESEIITCYMKIIENARIKDAVKAVRGAEPYGPAEYIACESGCCDLLQSVCKDEIHKELSGVVQEEINKHLITGAWDKLIEKYNEANAKLQTYEVLSDFVGKPFKLDINDHIVTSCAASFHGLMCEREKEIRKSPLGKSKEMPRVFHLIFSGDPAYDDFTMEHFANYRNKKPLPPN